MTLELKGKQITKEEFYQLYGLCVASVKLEQERNALCDAWEKIVGEKNRDRFWDFYDEGDLSQTELKKKLKFDGIEVLSK